MPPVEEAAVVLRRVLASSHDSFSSSPSACWLGLALDQGFRVGLVGSDLDLDLDRKTIKIGRVDGLQKHININSNLNNFHDGFQGRGAKVVSLIHVAPFCVVSSGNAREERDFRFTELSLIQYP